MRVVVMIITLVVTAGCRQIFGLADLPTDAGTIDAVDAGPCAAIGPSCAGDTLQTCTAIGQPPMQTACTWGCSATGTAHCGAFAPSGGGVTAMDVTTTTGLAATSLTAITNIDDTGAISGLRPAGTGTIVGIGFHISNNIAIYTFEDLSITNVVSFSGTHPIALVSTSTMTLGPGAGLDAQGSCNNNDSAIAGGSNGGGNNMAGSGPGGGAAGTPTNGGGAGGGFGAAGGAGGKNLNDLVAAPGPAVGTPELAMLVGGGGGGAGAGGNGGDGGAGGGAIQLVANGMLAIDGRITAGGCGGRHGGAGSGGGGGGAGGAILLEAHDIVVAGNAFFAANGGGGGGGNGGGNGNDGEVDGTTAVGGNNGGGNGGAIAKLGGTDGNNSAGGGGAVGRIRFNTRDGTVPTLTDAMSSPTRSQSPTTTTIGAAATQ